VKLFWLEEIKFLHIYNPEYS